MHVNPSKKSEIVLSEIRTSAIRNQRIVLAETGR